MSIITIHGPSSKTNLPSVFAWLQQMRAALRYPMPTGNAADVDRRRLVDRDITRIRLNSLDPRI